MNEVIGVLIGVVTFVIYTRMLWLGFGGKGPLDGLTLVLSSIGVLCIGIPIAVIVTVGGV